MYRDFLAECAASVSDDNLRLGHQPYAEIAPHWTDVSLRLPAAGETDDAGHLTRASALLAELAEREGRAMQVRTGLRAA